MNESIKTCISKNHNILRFKQENSPSTSAHTSTTPPAKKKNLIIFDW